MFIMGRATFVMSKGDAASIDGRFVCDGDGGSGLTGDDRDQIVRPPVYGIPFEGHLVRSLTRFPSPDEKKYAEEKLAVGQTQIEGRDNAAGMLTVACA